MAAAAHNPDIAAALGIPQRVARDFNQADKGSARLQKAMKEQRHASSSK